MGTSGNGSKGEVSSCLAHKPGNGEPLPLQMSGTEASRIPSLYCQGTRTVKSCSPKHMECQRFAIAARNYSSIPIISEKSTANYLLYKQCKNRMLMRSQKSDEQASLKGKALRTWFPGIISALFLIPFYNLGLLQALMDDFAGIFRFFVRNNILRDQ